VSIAITIGDTWSEDGTKKKTCQYVEVVTLSGCCQVVYDGCRAIAMI